MPLPYYPTQPLGETLRRLLSLQQEDGNAPVAYSYGTPTEDYLAKTLVNTYETAKEALALVESNPSFQNITFVSSLSDLPSPSGGVITLNGGAWVFTDFVDLQGNRLVYVGDTAILGTSSETSGITSTGLGAGMAIITGGSSLPVRDIRITVPSGTKAFSLTANSSTSALDWRALNVVSGEVGTIYGFSNFVMQDSAFLSGSYGLVFDGTIGTIAFETVLFSQPVGTMISLPASLIVSRRFRIIYSSFIVTSGNIGISASASASIPVEGYILDTVNFSGGGTYISGVSSTDNKALFENCRGIVNSGELGYMTMNANATPTIISNTNTPTKALGTTILQSQSQKFSHSNNRLTYTGALSRLFRVTGVNSFTSSNNNLIGTYIAKNGAVITASESYSTANSAGKAENVIVQCAVELNTGDYVELFVENNTGANNITVTDLSVIAESLN